jgi:hypothetical protein
VDETPPDNNGRSPTGRFVIGNTHARGNPHAGVVARFRSALLANITEADFSDVITTLVAAAKSGDMGAIKILFDRTLGRITDLVDVPPVVVVDADPRSESIDERRTRLRQMLEDLTPTQRRDLALNYSTRFERTTDNGQDSSTDRN